MDTVHFDSPLDDDTRRQRIYEGHVFVFSPRPSAVALCEFAKTLIKDAFHPLDPELAQHSVSVEEYAAILGELKPKFINHPKSKALLQALLAEFGCDPSKVYFDVPKMRSSTSQNYLTTGIAYAWHLHRDTWYSCPPCQINWWVPIYAIESSNAMAFHPLHWNRPVKNSSAGYDYYQWNKEFRGAHVAKMTKADTRPLPRALEDLDREPEIRLISPPGGMIMFSAAQMHSSVPNTSGRTRFSIDFRTVHVDDAIAERGAPNADAACTGTTMRDYLRGTDLAHIPDHVVAQYDDQVTTTGALVYDAAKHSS